MGYRSLAECVRDLEATGQLVVVDREVDPYLEVAAIQRRVYQAGGPALLFRARRERRSRSWAIFSARSTAHEISVSRHARIGAACSSSSRSIRAAWARTPGDTAALPRALWRLLARPVRSGPILAHQTTLDRLPQIQCWPMDGGPFITLPQVYTEDPDRPGPARSNLGMYRVQLAGNDYVPDREAGLHYQIHRGIGVHHAAAIARGEPLRVNVSVGGPPALAVAAVMPLPEGLPELAFAGALGGRRVEMVAPDGSADAGRGRFRDLRARSTPTSASPRDRSATTWAITVCSTIFPSCASIACITARAPSGRSRRWAGRRRKTRLSAPSSTS